MSVENTTRTKPECLKKTPCNYRHHSWQQCRHCFYYGFPGKQSGFSLIEFSIVIGIIAIVGSVSIFAWQIMSHQENVLEALPTTTIIQPITTPITLTPGHNYYIVPTQDVVIK
jgi:prepilin-type N-terminal cleavage/methylation domain-containing protein